MNRGTNKIKSGVKAAAIWKKRIEKLPEQNRWHTASIVIWDYIGHETRWTATAEMRKHLKDFMAIMRPYRDSYRPCNSIPYDERYMSEDTVKASLMAVGYDEGEASSRILKGYVASKPYLNHILK